MSKAAVFFLALALLFGGGYMMYMATRSTTGDDIQLNKVSYNLASDEDAADALKEMETAQDTKWVEDFSLVRRTNDGFDSSELRGKVWVTSFFFASCPSSCRQQNQTIGTLYRSLAKDGIQFVCITVDPENDTTERLREYADNFTSDVKNWMFLTGEYEYIRRIGSEKFQMAVGPQTHSSKLAVVDKWGNVRGQFSWDDDSELIALKELTSELSSETEELQEYIEKREQLHENLENTIIVAPESDDSPDESSGADSDAAATSDTLEASEETESDTAE